MAKTITTKYGTKINVDGLTPEQVARVKSTAEDKGAYGAKGAALAETFRKQNAAASQNASQNNASQASGGFKPATDSAGLEAQKKQIENEISRRGGADKAPGFAKQLEQVNAAIQNLGQQTPVSPDPSADPGDNTVVEKGPEVSPKQEDIPINTKVPVSGESLGIDPKVGTIDPNLAVPTVTGAAADDTNKTFQMMNPGVQTDALGNRQDIVVDPVTGQTSIKQSGGAGLTAANQAFTNAATNFANSGDAAKAAADANYKYLTRNLASQKADEMAAQKQELANRGIPLNFDSDPNNPNNLYARSLKSIDQKYQGLDDSANQQALMLGNQTLSTQAGVLNTLGNTVQGQSPTFTAFQGGQSTIAPNLQALLSTISQADLVKYGIEQDAATKKWIVKNTPRTGGGGGGGGDSSGIIIGGSAPGFGV